MRLFPMAACILASSALGSEAGADQLLESPEIGPRVKLSDMVKRNLNQYGNEVGLEIGELTMGMVQLQFDIEKKDGRFHLGGGDPEAFRLRFDSHIAYQSKSARVQSRVDLSVAGYGFALDLPTFDMRTESVVGVRAVALSIPFLEGSF